MVAAEMYREYEAEFQLLDTDPGGRDLRAFFLNPDLGVAEAQARAVADSLRASGASEDRIEPHVAVAERVAALRSDPRRDPRGEWAVTGGPADRVERAKVRERFSAVAIDTMRGLDDTVAPEHAVQEWLHLLRANYQDLMLFGDHCLERICEVSALLCRRIASGNYVRPTRPIGRSDAPVVTPRNRARAEAYIAECRAAGIKIRKSDIWGWKRRYKDRTEYERWQREDPRTTTQAREFFEHVMVYKPHLKQQKSA